MKDQDKTLSSPPAEMISLNLEDLEVEELEYRLELVALISSDNLRNSNCGCVRKSGG